MGFKYCHAKVTTERCILGLGLLRTFSDLILSLLALMLSQNYQGFLLQLKYLQLFIFVA